MAPSPKKHWSPHTRTRIATEYNLTRKPSSIAAKFGISKKAVEGIARRYKHQKSAQRKPAPPRQCKLTGRHRRQINRAIVQDPFISPTTLIKALNLPYSYSTLVRALKRWGIMYTKARTRAFLIEENAAIRLAFAEAHIGKPPQYWRRWAFADETTVQRGDDQKAPWVWLVGVNITLPLKV